MAATIVLAPDVRRIARDLIARHHQHLENATIIYALTDATRKKNGKLVLGTMQKLSAKDRFLSRGYSEGDDSGADYLMLISAEPWSELTPAQRTALVDHELCHAVVEYDDDTDEPSWGIRGHDFEDFTDIVRRHGLWYPDLEEAAAAMEQQRLPLQMEAV